MEEIIKIELNKNNSVCDLSEIELNNKITRIILKRLKKNPNIGFIRFKETSSHELVSKIEAQLIKQNQSYRSFPTDHVHCLLSSNCLETSYENNYSEYKFEEDKYKLLRDQGWKIHELFQLKGYKSVLYINNRTRNIVLAFQGIKLKVSDFFLDESQINSVIYSMLSNLDIAPQSVYSYLHTQSAVNLCKEKNSNYSLSFTGYGFGAWLAEQAVYYAAQDFKFANARTVTFDSPGSLDYLEKLSETNTNKKFDLACLDIVTYLSAPNFLNTCNRHIETIYRVYTDSKHLFDANSFVNKLIKEIPNWAQSAISKCYDKTMRSNLNRYSFYINGFKSMLSNGLQLILDEFDDESGKPFKFKLVEKWPLTVFKPSNDFKNNFVNIIDFKDIVENIPMSGHIPRSIKSVIAGLGNLLAKPILNAVTNNLLSGITVIINLIIEIKNGNLNDEQCLKCFQFEYDNENFEMNDSKKEFENNFKLSYEAHYKLNDVNLKRDTLSISNEGSVDQLLFNLKNYTKEKSDLNDLKNGFIENQLIELKTLFKLSTDGHNVTIEAENDTEIESIKFRLSRLLMLHDELKEFLYKLKFKKTVNNQIQLASSIEGNLHSCFVGRNGELKKLNDLLQVKQYVYIYGISGCGKSEIALNLALDYQEKQNYIVKSFSANKLLEMFRQLADDLQSTDTNKMLFNNMKPEDLFRRIKKDLNAFSKKENVNVLFVIDDLLYEKKEEEKEDFYYLTFGFNASIKFLVTTKNPLIDDNVPSKNKGKMELKLFDLNTALEYTDETLENSQKKKFKEEDWKNEIFVKMTQLSNEILPNDLVKLVAKVNEEEFWQLNDVIRKNGKKKQIITFINVFVSYFWEVVNVRSSTLNKLEPLINIFE